MPRNKVRDLKAADRKIITDVGKPEPEPAPAPEEKQDPATRTRVEANLNALKRPGLAGYRTKRGVPSVARRELVAALYVCAVIEDHVNQILQTPKIMVPGQPSRDQVRAAGYKAILKAYQTYSTFEGRADR